MSIRYFALPSGIHLRHDIYTQSISQYHNHDHNAIMIVSIWTINIYLAFFNPDNFEYPIISIVCTYHCFCLCCWRYHGHHIPFLSSPRDTCYRNTTYDSFRHHYHHLQLRSTTRFVILPAAATAALLGHCFGHRCFGPAASAPTQYCYAASLLSRRCYDSC